MADNSEVMLHGTRVVREERGSVVVTLPKEAVEESEIEVGEDVMVASTPEGPLTLLPWTEEAIRDLANRK